MEDNKQFDFLKESIEKRIKHIDGRRIYYRRQSFVFFISSAVLGGIVTILLGLNLQGWENEIRIASLIMTTLITFLSTYNSFFNYKDLWVANNFARNRFNELKFTIEYWENGDEPISDEQIESIRKSYQEILNELNQSWMKSKLEESQ